MIILKLVSVLAILLLVMYFSLRLIKRGMSKRYEPKARTPWNTLSDGEDPTL